MKGYILSEVQITALLHRESVGSLATWGEDGFACVVPVHFAYTGGAVYMHGLAAEDKLEAIRRNPKVCLEVRSMQLFLPAGKHLCGVDARCEVAIVRGHASIIGDRHVGTNISAVAVRPIGQGYPDALARAAAAIRLDVESCTGKYFSV